MREHNFILCNTDTDAITVCKPDYSSFDENERNILTNELNSLFERKCIWELEAVYSKIICIKAKNYILLTEDNKIIYKGSALRSPKLEKALNEFIHKIVEAILADKINFTDIYNEYVKEINNIQDINRWTSRYTISQKTLESDRTNEAKIRDALEGSEYVEGDRVYCYFTSDNSLKLVENFNMDYNKDKLLEKLHKAGNRFSTVLPVKELFINYKLKKNKKLLELL